MSAPFPVFDLAVIARAFPLPGRYLGSAGHGSGHINDTFAAEFATAEGRRRFLLQRINDRVFRDIPALMENIQRVTRHAAMRHSGAPDLASRSLQLVAATDGQPYHRDAAGGWWRCYRFIEGARSYDVVRTPAHAEAAARAFGEFQRLLVDLPGGRLHETIPAFHDTRRRFAALQHAIELDAAGRAAGARAEIAFALAHEPLTDVLLRLQAAGAIPERVAHNDAKFNNVMLDDATGAALCVVDLDTVMPGLALHDFGDLVRSATNAAAEDEPDIGRVHARPEIFAALAAGYLASAGAFLNAAEIAHLAASGSVITFEQGIRFLTDHLAGDRYYKIKHPGHNLERAASQFALVRSLEAQRGRFETCVHRLAAMR